MDYIKITVTELSIIYHYYTHWEAVGQVLSRWHAHRLVQLQSNPHVARWHSDGCVKLSDEWQPPRATQCPLLSKRGVRLYPKTQSDEKSGSRPLQAIQPFQKGPWRSPLNLHWAEHNLRPICLPVRLLGQPTHRGGGAGHPQGLLQVQDHGQVQSLVVS